MQQVARESRWFEIAASVFAFVVLAPFLAIAILPFGLIGLPVLLSLLLPVTAISAGSSS
jgi:hypothetical protein